MASPTFRSVSFDSGSAASFTATEPSGAASGDGMLLLALVELAHSAAVPPSGWSQVPDCYGLDVGTSFVAYTLEIRRGASAPALNFSWSGGSKYYEWSVYAFQGVKSSGSIIDASATSASSSGTQPDPPSIVTTTDDTLICALAWHWAGWGGSGASPPSGYTLRFGEAFFDHALATLPQGAAGTANPGTFSGAGGTDVMRGMTVAIASDGGGGGGGGEVAPVDHSSVLSFPALCRKPQNDDGRWIRGKGGLWQRRAA